MALVAMIYLLFVFPWLGPTLAWRSLSRHSNPTRWIIGFLIGIAPANLYAWHIYNNESGGGTDPDPLGFFWVSFTVSTFMAVFTVISLHYAKARE